MSAKAYYYRMRTCKDVEDLQKLINIGAIYLDGIYTPRARTLQFYSTDMVAAITTFDGCLEGVRLWATEERSPRIHLRNNRPYFRRLDEIPRHFLESPDGVEHGFRVKGWELPDGCDGDNWTEFCLAYFEEHSGGESH